MPSAARCSGFRRWCVVVSGWVMRLLASPRLLEMPMIESALAARNAAALPPATSKATQRAAAAHLAARELRLRMIGAAGIEHADDVRAAGEEIGDPLGRAHLRLDPDRQRLQRLQQRPGVERREARAGLAQEVVDMVGDEFLARENDAAEHPALPVDMLGRGIDDAVGAERQRMLEQRRGENIVDDQRRAVLRARSPRRRRCR